MCGILAVLGCGDESQGKRVHVLELSRRLKHRGPDWSGLHQLADNYLCHQRLAIIDPASGDQPLYNEDKSVAVAVNGEIYNHEDLRARLSLSGHSFRTGSDCEAIAHLSFPTPTKIEPAWGGNGGSAQDITAKPRRLESITIHSGFVIDSFAFSYIAQDGETRAAGPWGGSRGHIETIKFGPAEFVKEISGTVGEIDSRTVISSLKFVTNLKTYGPFGRGQGKKFSYSVPENKSVVAFFGRSEKYLDAIGVHTA